MDNLFRSFTKQHAAFAPVFCIEHSDVKYRPLEASLSPVEMSPSRKRSAVTFNISPCVCFDLDRGTC